MKKPSRLSHVRNIGVAAHVDAGKTTLTERILFYTGASHKIGEVHDGAAHMDYLVEEQRHGITITAAVTQTQWREHLIQIIDTPGHVDFSIEVERTMRVLDGVVIVLDGVRGVEPQTETVWRQRARFRLPALLFINKLDRPGADFDRCLASVKQRLHAEPVPITVPIPEAGGVLHLIDQTLIRFMGQQGERLVIEPCPPELWAHHRERRESLVLAAAEVDASLADLVLSGGDPPPDKLRAAIRAGTLAGTLFPSYSGSALRNLGVQPLLDGVIDFLPAPLDRPDIAAERPDGQCEQVVMTPDGPLVALAFKVQFWEGRRHVFVRLYRGRLAPGDTVEYLAPDGRLQREQVARLFEVDAGKKTRCDLAEAGDIVLLAGLRFASTGDTLCTPGQVLRLERIQVHDPVLGLAIEPAAGTELDRLVEALNKVQQEDPTLRVEEDPETGQRLLKGMGELHLQIVIERLEREFGVGVRTGRPAVAMRETITQPASAEAVFTPPPTASEARQPDWTVRARVSVQPSKRGDGTRVELQPRLLPEGIQLDLIQTQAIQEAIEATLASGLLQGAQMLDLVVSLDELELGGTGLTPVALAAAVGTALRKALAEAHPVRMTPVMRLEVIIPESNLGAVLGDLQARHALIQATEIQDGQATIRAEAALEPLLGYATTLRGLTQGRGQFSLEFERFDR
ncbi:MAG: elongation factor G [Thermochromatium sp.]